MTPSQTDAVSFYSDVAEAFHDSYNSDANRQERLRVWRRYLDKYGPGAGSAYDIGCGSGILACELASRGIETVGIDGAPAMLKIAREMAKSSGLQNVTFRQHRLPPPATAELDPVDLVISSSAIEYLESIHDALLFVRQILKPNGIVLFSVSNRASWSRAAVRLAYRIAGRPPYIGLLKHFMTVSEIRDELEDAGLTYLEHSFFARADRVNRVLGHVLPPPMSSNMIIVAASRR